MEKGDKIVEGFTTDEIGYSESKVDQNTELQAGQWLDFQKGSGSNFSQTLRKSLVELFERNNNELQNISDEALMVFQKGGQISDELTDVILYLQDIQKLLLRALNDDETTLTWAKLPKEVQNLLK
ncbi:MAG: hypothetical protein HZC02_04710 [Candidatus Levybacteria bacterium]|nr:hypothetical protein [Candidatus Levybacteria bacterium]